MVDATNPHRWPPELKAKKFDLILIRGFQPLYKSNFTLDKSDLIRKFLDRLSFNGILIAMQPTFPKVLQCVQYGPYHPYILALCLIFGKTKFSRVSKLARFLSFGYRNIITKKAMSQFIKCYR